MVGVDWLWAPTEEVSIWKVLCHHFQRKNFMLSSGLASDSLLFPNPASPDPVRDDEVVISSCNRRHQLTEAVKGELYIDSLETST